MEQVVWADVNGFEGRYQVSNKGIVRSLDIVIPCRGNGKRVHKGRIMPTRVNNRGYETVALNVDNRSITKLVHRLVAESFVPNPCKKCQVNHIDKDISNNCASNLEWVTDNENKEYSSISSGGTQRPRRPVVAVNIDTGMSCVYEGLRAAERALHIDHGTAMKVVHGKAKQAKGYFLSYAGGDAECQH